MQYLIFPSNCLCSICGCTATLASTYGSAFMWAIIFTEYAQWRFISLAPATAIIWQKTKNKKKGSVTIIQNYFFFQNISCASGKNKNEPKLVDMRRRSSSCYFKKCALFNYYVFNVFCCSYLVGNIFDFSKAKKFLKLTVNSVSSSLRGTWSCFKILIIFYCLH